MNFENKKQVNAEICCGEIITENKKNYPLTTSLSFIVSWANSLSTYSTLLYYLPFLGWPKYSNLSVKRIRILFQFNLHRQDCNIEM